MNFDISHILDHWEYRPGEVLVRRFIGKDGVEKIQLRLDLGILQMNAQGRPDGKKPFGHPSLFDFYQARLKEHRRRRGGSEDGFTLKSEDCARLQLEAIQYHHRYVCLMQLEDHAAVVRDTEHNLGLSRFVEAHAESDELAWSLLQFRPQTLMIHTRAVAMQHLQTGDFPAAIREIEGGLESLREFYQAHSRQELIAQSHEISALERWLDDVRAKRPLSKREKLEKDLQDAVLREDYERAARVRDALRNLKTPD